MREHTELPPKDICNALLEYAVKRDDRLRQIGEGDRNEDKNVFIIKRNCRQQGVTLATSRHGKRHPAATRAGLAFVSLDYFFRYRESAGYYGCLRESA